MNILIIHEIDWLKKVIYEPVKLDQEYREFDFESPWEGTKYIKQEEEKNKNKDK